MQSIVQPIKVFYNIGLTSVTLAQVVRAAYRATIFSFCCTFEELV